MKALKRFYGKKSRKWYDVGDDVLKEDEKGLPKGLIGDDASKAKKVDKVASKVSTKNGKPKNSEDKSKKK